MPDTKITALTALTAADPANDVLPIVDVSDTTMAASGTTKKISINNVLGCSGTATLASATITGDLTVDTSTLYVSSSADKVGIGTTSLSNEKLTVAGNISANAWLGRSNISVPAGDCSIFRSADNTLGFGIASTTAMTLNSTGLGVGVSPAVLLDVQSASAVIRATSSTGTNTSFAAFANTGGAVRVGAENSAGGGLFTGSSAYSAVLGTTGAYSAHIGTSGAVRMTVDSSGNVGIGVAPSAKLHVEGGGAQARFSIASASDARHEYYRNGIREGLIYWDANLVGLYATQAAGEVVIASSNTIRARVKASGQVRFVPLASDPAGAEAGDVYYNSTSNKLKCYNGTTWNDLF